MNLLSAFSAGLLFFTIASFPVSFKEIPFRGTGLEGKTALPNVFEKPSKETAEIRKLTEEMRFALFIARSA